MSPSPLRLLLLLLAALTAPACITLVEEAERDCPCSEGWTCCNGQCLPAGAYCPAPPPPPDTTPPEAPRLDGVHPASPTQAEAVDVSGTSEAGALVRLYAQAACAGEPVAEVRADGNGTFLALQLALTPDATTSFSARALDAAGNVSPCSAGALAVTQDGTAPQAPLVEGFVPASPSRTSTQPVLSGRAEPGARVVLHADEACTRALPFEGVADAGGAFHVWARVEANTATSFYAVAVDAAGNVSACSAASPVFEHDDVAPAAPVLVEPLPRSPSQLREVHWEGRAEPGARVRLFSDAACQEVASAELQADAAGAWAVDFTASANAETRRWALSSDAAGNLGVCTELGRYVHDTLSPATPYLSSFTTPESPSNSPRLTLKGDVWGESAGTVRLYDAAGCDASHLRAEVQLDGWGRFQVDATVSEPTTSFYAQAEDAAGNLSACTLNPVTYVWDTTPPPPPTQLTFTHPSPLREGPAELRLFGRTETNTRVDVFTSEDCAPETLVGSDTSRLSRYASGSGTVTFQAPLAGAAEAPWRSYWARATDFAGNPSACAPAGALVQAADGALAWGAPEELPFDATLLRFDGQGRLYALGHVPQADGTRSYALHRRAPGGSWELLRVVVAPGPSYTYGNLAVDAAGNAAVLWSSGPLKVGRYEAATGAWDETTLSTGAKTAFEEPLAFGPGGRAWVCWTDVAADATLREGRCASASPGGPWETTPVLVTASTLYELRALPGVDGRVRVTWMSKAADGTPSRWDLHLRGYAPETGWGEDMVVATLGSSAQLATGPDGTAWFAYAAPEREGEQPSVWVRRSAPDALTWGPAEQVSAPGAVDTPVLAAGDAGEAVLTWRETAPGSVSGFRLFVRHHAPEGGWSFTFQVPVDGPGHAVLNGVVTAGPGRAWVVWREDVYLSQSQTVSMVVARAYERDVGVGPLQVVVSDPQLGYTNWDWNLFTADAGGRFAAAATYDDGFTGRPDLRVLRVLE